MSSPKRERPSHFRCAWCGKSKRLARTGRPPTYCSDWCRRAEPQAKRQLQQARWDLERAKRDIERLEGQLRHAEELRANTVPMF